MPLPPRPLWCFAHPGSPRHRALRKRVVIVIGKGMFEVPGVHSKCLGTRQRQQRKGMPKQVGIYTTYEKDTVVASEAPVTLRNEATYSTHGLHNNTALFPIRTYSRRLLALPVVSNNWRCTQTRTTGGRAYSTIAQAKALGIPCIRRNNCTIHIHKHDRGRPSPSAKASCIIVQSRCAKPQCPGRDTIPQWAPQRRVTCQRRGRL